MASSTVVHLLQLARIRPGGEGLGLELSWEKP